MASGKNTHLEHVEDEIINLGAEGGRKAIEILRYMGEFLSGKPSAKVTVKFDGAPAIVCGTDPSDGKFFVGTKSVFAKNSKLCKTQADVQTMYDGGLAAKLSDCLRYLPECNIKGVLQGDLMFTDDKKKEKIHDVHYLTFRPNTITYAVQPTTPLGKTIDSAKLGIVFHTKYTGSSIAEMTASFHINDDDFKSTTNVWAQKAEFTNIGGTANLSTQEKLKYDKAVNKAEGSIRQAGPTLNAIQSGKRTLKIDTEFLKFFNRYVKAGREIPSVERAYVEFAHHLGKEFNKAIEKNLQLKSQAEKAGQFIDLIEFMEKNQRGMKMVIAAYMNIQSAKMILVDKMKMVNKLNLFVDKGTHYETTSDEGYVAIVGDKATKLIDRLEFSKLNFTVPKVW